MQLPPSIWIAGLFNPMGFVTATLQVTARRKELPLDAMVVHTEVTDKDAHQMDAQPSDGDAEQERPTNLVMPGTRWREARADARPRLACWPWQQGFARRQA